MDKLLTVTTELDGIKIVELDEQALYGDINPYTDEGIKIFLAYCAENEYLHYYGMPDMDFSVESAIAEAHANNCTHLLLDNLS